MPSHAEKSLHLCAMISVAYPSPQFRTESREGQTFIFDALRKVWLLLTPEEWVRQNFVQYLLQVAAYPATLIALEKELDLNGMRRRFDVLVYNKEHQPWMLIECKAEAVKLTEDVLQQVLRYNISLPVPYIVITNGRQTRAWQKEGGGLRELAELPEWETHKNDEL